MECLPVENIPEGKLWTYELLCGPPHRSSFCGAARYVAFNDAGSHIRSVVVISTPHNQTTVLEGTGAARRLPSSVLVLFSAPG
jgi:hypothetical protein